ncbi:MAG: ABC transporter permease [Hyphomicrobium sp.]|nr:MAG: ABC transporter permease [Hyphomicrobium sp.]PPD01690.1 MAG: ABC transporter permease [Hyphomicrobium sp.]
MSPRIWDGFNTVTAATAAAACLAFVASLMLGSDGFGLPHTTDVAQLVFWEIRFPRAVLGFFTGAALGLSGAVLQGYLRNPLAEPGLLGMTGGASLGAVIAIHSGLSGSFALALPLAGLLGAGVATLVIVALAGSHSSTTTLILAGVAISSLAGALTSLALNLSANPFAATEIMFWLMGSLTDRSLLHVWLATPLIIVGLAMLLTTARDLDALSLGEEVATNLGVDPVGLRFKVIAGAALAVGAATAVTGAIAFVGLMVPHFLRRAVAEQPGRLLLPSLLGGGAFVLAVDVALRLLSPLADVRLGVLTALIGAPFFLWLVVKKRWDDVS